MHPSDKRFVRRLLAAIDKEEQQWTANLVEGTALTYDDYRYRCGFLRGLLWVRESCQQIIESDDPDDPREG